MTTLLTDNHLHIMKKLLLLPLFVLLLFACKKPNDPDPRDDMPGTYNIALTVVAKNLTTGATNTSTATQAFTVTKGTSTNDIKIVSTDGTWTATTSGSNFTINPTTAPITVGASTYTGTTTGSGSIAGGVMTVNYTLAVTVGNQSITSNGSGSGKR